MRFDEPLRRVLNPKTADALTTHLGLCTVGDLLGHYPRRYVQRGELTELGDLRVGEHVTVQARVDGVEHRSLKKVVKGRPGVVTQVTVSDGRDRLVLKFFNQGWRTKDLHPGARGLFAGQVEAGYRGQRELIHPDYQLLDAAAEVDEFVGAILPIYPASAKVSTWMIARSLRTVLDTLGELPDPLPEAVRRAHGLVGVRGAYCGIHRPESMDDLKRARRRLTWDEAFLLQVALAQRRAATRALPAVPRVARPDGLLAAFDAQLPFALTQGQREVGEVLAAELSREHPMHRLLQGEVGSGKTVVALRAMLAVVDAGGQAALLAPTEVLAAQHHRSIRALMGPLAAEGEPGAAPVATRVALLTGSQGAAARRRALAEAASGQAGIVVGTHALLHEGVEFADLGLVVVDEQHRFGVEQRDALRAKGVRPPHVLVLTATPIPRTVAMTVYGDLETSALRELPAGRAQVRTHVVRADNRAWVGRMWGRVREEVAAGHQAYVVCPRIGEGLEEASGEDDAEVVAERESRRPALAVLDVAPQLAAGALAGLRLGVLHGRLSADDKGAVMRRFVAGDLDVLVATTVVEVGVDVPNATVMVVMDADRFGVSQLHQLRGRVGRGGTQGWCLLHTEVASDSPPGQRLAAVAATLDGFTLARVDLEQRREGDVLGAAQSGRRSSLRLLSLLRDEDVIRDAREAASDLVGTDPDLTKHPALAALLAVMLDEERAEFLEKA